MALQELKTMFPLLEAIVSFIDEGVIIATRDGNIIFQNPAAGELLGIKSSEPIKSLKEAGTVDLINCLEEARAASFAKGQKPAPGRTAMFELRIRTDKGYRDLEFHFCLSNHMTGDLILLIMRDRTPQRRLEAVLNRPSSDLITKDPVMLDVFERIEQIAPTEASVLIQGESGTGKTQIARMIHRKSHRSEKAMVELNCAAIPETLIESELFGHKKGAFTGATQDRIGRFQSADGSTLFLDEISELPLHLQAKLLRVIQDKAFEPVGADRPVKVDVRIIAAANQNLRDMVDEGTFRADLYYRLAVIPIHIPALRDRPGDIPLLLQYFCHNLESRGYPSDIECGTEAMRMMMDYPWPGNVRELENAVEHALICARDKKVSPEALPQDVRNYCEMRPVTDKGDEDNHMRLEIISALTRAEGNKLQAARELGIDRTTLWRRMRKLNLQ